MTKKNEKKSEAKKPDEMDEVIAKIEALQDENDTLEEKILELTKDLVEARNKIDELSKSKPVQASNNDVIIDAKKLEQGVRYVSGPNGIGYVRA